jgi:hypothetical protein
MIASPDPPSYSALEGMYAAAVSRWRDVMHDRNVMRDKNAALRERVALLEGLLLQALSETQRGSHALRHAIREALQ